MNGKLNIDTKTRTVTYTIIDIEEPVTKRFLRNTKELLNGDFTFVTNAGVEIHSSEMKYGKWNGITFKRL